MCDRHQDRHGAGRRRNAFDLFFTTKPLREGTGFGLSMIYGFAKQSGGHVRVDSQIGVGATMCTYLPRYVTESDVFVG
jgi:signal transduction histidine kinase